MNVSVLKMVVFIIGMVILTAMVGVIYLIAQERQVPGTLETIAVASLTGLLGLLAPSREAAN